MFIISSKQAREFAGMIYKDIRKFCEDHPEEFAAFLNNEQYTRENDEMHISHSNIRDTA